MLGPDTEITEAAEAELALAPPPDGPPLVLEDPGQIDRQARLKAALAEHFQSVWCTARRLGLSPMRADEATQEAFIIFANKLDQVTRGSERRYLTSVAVRLASNYRRTRAAEAELYDERAVDDYVDPEPLADELVDLKKLRDVLDHALSHLPFPLREVFVLYELEGMNAPEMAELLGLPQGTVASRLRKAREVFASVLRRLRARHTHSGGTP